MTDMTQDEWGAEAKRRFGDDPMKWKFVCPVCGLVQSTQDYKDAGAPSTTVAFSCVGRWKEGVDCNYAGGGLFRLNPVNVKHDDGEIVQAFNFAEEDKS